MLDVIAKAIGKGNFVKRHLNYFKLSTLLVAFFLSGCTASALDFLDPYPELNEAINKYNVVAPQVQLNQSKSQVLSILLPTQRGIEKFGRQPDQFQKDGKRIEIFYMRSNRVDDGRTTDDELTPYVFVDDTLVAVGWRALGGPRTAGKVDTGARSASSQRLIDLGLSIANPKPRQAQPAYQPFPQNPTINCRSSTTGIYTNTSCQ
ncbi:MAG: DUF3192 domain-containing protein [Rhodospirillaceae bacterium]|nr:DUF3192 domain-containing protein [Rhodospirillaceae bacterium]MBT5561315.1 DUF3192 domain-containing protein [Rhodospirillaceae bacterium]MBT6243390.1 DUF3192 domain-containing protein [Rhodospirillaceae bacterium]